MKMLSKEMHGGEQLVFRCIIYYYDYSMARILLVQGSN